MKAQNARPDPEGAAEGAEGALRVHDVTAGYIMRDVERLRKPMQRISAFLVGQMFCDANKNGEFSEEAIAENYSTVS